jgi:uncharacterized membrane protein YphA (DoxX/SURF4 family)
MKRDKILYWIFTGLVSLGFAASSIMYLTKSPQLVDGFKFLGLPQYLIPILGIAKLTGALALINPWFPKLKEWAYAGFTFTLIGASWSHIATNTPFSTPLVFLALVAVSYLFHTRVSKQQTIAGPSREKSTRIHNQAILVD